MGRQGALLADELEAASQLARRAELAEPLAGRWRASRRLQAAEVADGGTPADATCTSRGRSKG